MIPRDTTVEAYRVQTEIYRRMGPSQKLSLALKMSDEARQVVLDGIRMRHPDYSREQARFALMRLIHGDALFSKAWPDAPLVDP